MAIQVRILPPSSLYISDPQETNLGKRILSASIPLINKLGLEGFTFRKLSIEIGSVEASIYRYFSNKNQLLLYLTNWYWDWVHHLVNEEVILHRDPKLKLKAAIRVLAKPWSNPTGVTYIDQEELHQLVINEGTKAYRTKLVDQKNNRGLFLGYKSLTEDISLLLLSVNPGFAHPRALASSIFEMAHDHPFFARHIPRLTDLNDGDNLGHDLEEMLCLWTTRLLHQPRMNENSGKAFSPYTVFVTRNLKADSALRQWATTSGNSVIGRSLLRLQEVPFEVPEEADWWFFYSPKAVEFCLFSAQLPQNIRLAAFGEGTAKTLQSLVGRVGFIGQGSSTQVAKQFKAVAAGNQVFFPRARNSGQSIQRLLADDITVLDAVTYDNQPVPAEQEIEADVFIFTSPLNVAAYLDHHKLKEGTKVLAIGGITAAALYERGYAAAFPSLPSEEELVALLD